MSDKPDFEKIIKNLSADEFVYRGDLASYEPTGFRTLYHNDAVQVLEKLWSSHVEPLRKLNDLLVSEYERVNGCLKEAYEQQRKFIDENEELQSEIVRLKEEKWISVKDRLPEPELEVLICYRFPSGRQVQAICFVTKAHPDIFDHVYFELITHWQPLPEPPTLLNG